MKTKEKMIEVIKAKKEIGRHLALGRPFLFPKGDFYDFYRYNRSCGKNSYA